MREIDMEEIELVSGGRAPNNIYWSQYTSSGNPFGELLWDNAVTGGNDGWTMPNGESLPT